MKHIKRVIVLHLIVPGVLLGFGKKTFFGSRSQAANTRRELVGWQQEVNLYGIDENYGTIAGVLEYSHSFNSKKISTFLFGSTSLTISGSRVQNRSTTDILADYFGLPADYKSTICFEPRISNIIFDLDWYQALDEYLEGLYFKIHVPIARSKWDLNVTERRLAEGTAFYPAGYMGAERIDRSQLAQSFIQSLRGTTRFGDMRNPLKFGKYCGAQKITRVAALEGVLGWNFLQDDRYHIGLNLRASAPTGNKPDAEFMFEPQVGNRHHWEFGVGFTSHVMLWEDEDQYNAIGLYVDANITHLFGSKQMRSYDFITNGPGSRYILLEDMINPALNLEVDDEVATIQYNRRLLPAINLTTLESKINIDVQGDVVIKLTYQRGGFEFDAGYNLWGMSKEKLACRTRLEEQRYALKGDAQLYGFDDDNNATPLNATQSKATIRAGQLSGNSEFNNENVDNAADATDSAKNDLMQLNVDDSADLGIDQDVVQLSNPPILITDCDIDNSSVLLPRALSHTFFVHLNYNWDVDRCILPYLGGGASVELADTGSSNNSAYSQWTIWVKGGVSY